MKTILNLNDAQDLLTPEAIKENCDLEPDDIQGTVKIYLADLAQRKIDVIGWTADELYEDFKLWYYDDYTNDDELFDGEDTGWWDGDDLAEYHDNGVDNTVL